MIKTLRYRGYVLGGDFDMTQAEFISRYEDEEFNDIKRAMSAEFIVEGTKSGGLPKIMVIWLTDRKLGANIRDVNDKLAAENTTHAIVIADEGITPQARETVRSLRVTKKIHIDVWTLPETMIFAPEHKLVPEHRICSTSERKRIFKTYGLSSEDKKIPHIRHDDIMVRYLGATKNQLIEIRRPSETNEGQFDLTYRLVC